MSGTELRIALVALVTSAAVTSFLITSGGPALSLSIPSPTVQSDLQHAWALIGGDSQGQGYTILAGTTVRDHRSSSKSSSNVTDNRSRTDVKDSHDRYADKVQSKEPTKLEIPNLK